MEEIERKTAENGTDCHEACFTVLVHEACFTVLLSFRFGTFVFRGLFSEVLFVFLCRVFGSPSF
jgi:hypothetical protein